MNVEVRCVEEGSRNCFVHGGPGSEHKVRGEGDIREDGGLRAYKLMISCRMDDVRC